MACSNEEPPLTVAPVRLRNEESPLPDQIQARAGETVPVAQIPARAGDTIKVRSDQVPNESVAKPAVSDGYIEGYLQALLDMNYYEFRVKVVVKNQKVYLSNLPTNPMLASSIMAFVEDFPGVKEVKVEESVVAKAPEKPSKEAPVTGIWLPQSTVLFQPFVADTRQVTYGAGLRFHDTVFGKHLISVAFGDELPIFRWFNVLPWHGDLQVDLEAGVWALFDIQNRPTGHLGSLLNADYYVGIPFTYAINRWSFRARIYHISSHLGDGYITMHPDAPVLRPSIEAVDLYASYQLIDALRIYGGAGYIIGESPSYRLKRPYIQYGAELRLMGHRFKQLYGQPFFAFDANHKAFRDWNMDATYVIGYEWSKLQGVGRKVRVSMQYHQGYAEEGQFQKLRQQYLSFNLGFGF